MSNQSERPMHHLYPKRGPIRAVVGALTQAADAMADAASEIVSFEPPRVGAVDENIATSRGASVLYAGAWGTLAYTLYAGKFIVSKHHPILGTVAALLGLANLSSALFSDTVKAKAA